MDEDDNRNTDWNAWAMPARRPSGITGAPQPPPPPPSPGPLRHWGAPPPPPSPYGGHWGGPAPYGPQPYGPQPHGQPYGGYGSPYGGWGPPAQTSGLAIASLVCGLLWLYWLGSILALVFGYVAKGQIDRSHGSQTGRGMAVAGIVLGWIGVGFLVLIIVLGVVTSATSDPGPNSF